MLDLISSLIIFFSIVLINELFNMEEIYYLLLGIASSFLLFNFSYLVENRTFSLTFLYLSIAILIMSVLLVAYVYVKKLTSRQNENY